MENIVYYQIAPGIKMALPKTLSPNEVEKRICKFLENLDRDKPRTYNPKIKNFNPCK